MKMLRGVTDRLELGVVDVPDGGNSIDLQTANTLAAVSTAISLKRLADAAEVWAVIINEEVGKGQ